MTTRLFLIRHGKTDYSTKKKYCGFTDIPLNKEGLMQAENLKLKFAGLAVDTVYSSDLKRALDTARTVFPGKKIIQEHNLREMNFGSWEGMTHEEILTNSNRDYSRWMDNIAGFPAPDGECLNDVNGRVMKTVNNILDTHAGKTVVIVTHGGPISIILCNAENKKLKNFWGRIPPHGSLTEIRFNEKRALTGLVPL